MTTKTQEHPWDLQPRETTKSYSAFRQYLDLGPSRSLPECAQRMGYSHTSQVGAWSAKYHWVRRAQQYDAAHHTERDNVDDQRGEVVAIILDAAPQLATTLVEIANNDKNSGATRVRAVVECMNLLGMGAPIKVEHSGPNKGSIPLGTIEQALRLLPPESIDILAAGMPATEPD